MSSPPTHEPTDETVQEVPSQTFRQKIVAKLRGLPDIPIGLRLFPIVFLCNFIEISQAEIVIIADDWWKLCVPWSVKRNTWKCTGVGGGITLAVIIQYGWPVTGLIGAILVPRLSKPKNRVQLLRDLVRAKLLTMVCFILLFWVHWWLAEDILCLALIVASFFSTYVIILVCKMMVVDATRANQSWMIQLGIVLGAYKASSAVSYVVVRWIMKVVGFQVLLPILVIASGSLGFYTWSPYIVRYPVEDVRGAVVTGHAVSSTHPDRTEGAGDIMSAEPSNAANEGHRDENDSTENAQTSPSSINGFIPPFIQGYLTDHTKLLKTSYFLGVFATGFLDPLALPNERPDLPPYDRSRFLPNMPNTVQAVALLFVLPLFTVLMQKATRRQAISIGNDEPDTGALEEQLNVNNGHTRERTGFSLDIWVAVVCLIVSAITIALITPPWKVVKMVLVVIPVFTFSVGIHPALQSALSLSVPSEERGTQIARLEVIQYLAMWISAFTIGQLDLSEQPTVMLGLNSACLIVLSISSSLAAVFAILTWWRRRKAQAMYHPQPVETTAQS
ncbi:hypothetical protein CPB86DRAFT_788082 [Serendipita vermifera]|nr:hypothetical protein CPB86DRAFT_788082 [Serendipita vermifera]